VEAGAGEFAGTEVAVRIADSRRLDVAADELGVVTTGTDAFPEAAIVASGVMPACAGVIAP